MYKLIKSNAKEEKLNFHLENKFELNTVQFKTLYHKIKFIFNPNSIYKYKIKRRTKSLMKKLVIRQIIKGFDEFCS